MTRKDLRSTLKKIGGYLFFNTFVQIPAIWKRRVKQKPKPLYRFRFCLAEKQGFVGTKCRNSGTSMLAYKSEAPAWRRQGSVPYCYGTGA